MCGETAAHFARGENKLEPRAARAGCVRGIQQQLLAGHPLPIFCMKTDTKDSVPISEIERMRHNNIILGTIT